MGSSHRRRDLRVAFTCTVFKAAEVFEGGIHGEGGAQISNLQVFKR